MIVTCIIPIPGELTVNEQYEAELIEFELFNEDVYNSLYRIVNDKYDINLYDINLFMNVTNHRDFSISKIPKTKT